MRLELLIYALYSVVTLLYGSVFTLLFLDIKLSERRNWGVFISFVLAELGIQFGVGYFNSIKLVVQMYPLIVHFPLLLLCLLYYRRKVVPTLASIMMCYFLTSPRFILAELITLLAPMLPYDELMGKIIASLLLVFPIYKWMVPVMRKGFRRKREDILHFFVPLIIVYIFSYTCYIYTDLVYKQSVLLMELIFTLFFLIIFYYLQMYYVSVDDLIEREKRNQILMVSAESLHKQLDLLNESYEKTKILRHDIRHYATMVKQHAVSGEIERVIEISEEIERKNSENTVKRYCANQWVNLLLSAYVAQLEEVGATPILEVAVPAEISIREMDLCVVLGNILDNAVRSIDNFRGERFCYVRLCYEIGKLYLEVRNSCQEPVAFCEGLPLSNRNGHGYGCKSIAYIAEKYHGISSFELQDNVFVTQIIMHEQ